MENNGSGETIGMTRSGPVRYEANVENKDRLVPIERCSDGLHRAGVDGVLRVFRTGDGKVEFIEYGERTIAYVRSAMGYPAYYPLHPACIEKPVRAVLMDLDGTSVHSESFWIWIIEKTTASLLNDPGFRLQEADLPYVSGHSVSEHLQYCLKKYAPDKSLEEARRLYFRHTHFEMEEILQGRGRPGAFTPAPGLKPFLLKVKEAGISIGLVTSGLYEKAWPEIYDAFQSLGMGDPKDFYDTIITAGFPLRRGGAGTLGELSPKPHPWLYAEAARVGLGIEFEDRHRVVGIEDSGAGICSIRLAGFAAIGMSGGNVVESGTLSLCSNFCRDFDSLLEVIL